MDGKMLFFQVAATCFLNITCYVCLEESSNLKLVDLKLIASNPNQSKAALASPQSQNATTFVSLDLQILVPSGWGGQ